MFLIIFMVNLLKAFSKYKHLQQQRIHRHTAHDNKNKLNTITYLMAANGRIALKKLR